MTHSTKNQDKGFTLVELLIVIVILGILATVTVFAVSGLTQDAQTNACGIEQKNIETAAAAFEARNNGTVASADGDLAPTFIEQAALDKFTVTYDASGVVLADGTECSVA